MDFVFWGTTLGDLTCACDQRDTPRSAGTSEGRSWRRRQRGNPSWNLSPWPSRAAGWGEGLNILKPPSSSSSYIFWKILFGRHFVSRTYLWWSITSRTQWHLVVTFGTICFVDLEGKVWKVATKIFFFSCKLNSNGFFANWIYLRKPSYWQSLGRSISETEAEKNPMKYHLEYFF